MHPFEFVHLRLHTEFSLVDGMVRIKPLMNALSHDGAKSVAITDFCNLFAAVKFFQEAIAKGIKPIFGAELPCIRGQDLSASFYSVVVLCQNDKGYRHLTQLVSKAYLEGQYQGQPRVLFDWFLDHAEGLIVLSGGRMGDIGQALLANDFEKAEQYAKEWANLFPGRFYLELQRLGHPEDEGYNHRALLLADRLRLPVVATNGVCFLQENEFEAHEARVCIHEGYTLTDPRRLKKYVPAQYLKSSEEMCALFADIPDAIENTVYISQRCSVKLALGQAFLPNFTVPAAFSVETYLLHLAQEGFQQRWPMIQRQRQLQDDDLMPVYRERLNIELDVINRMGFAGYFLIVADFIGWSRQHGVPVGPGRGSGAGSLVAYALKITDLDPLQYDLLFERFLNPERVSMPDFDIDFCMEGRDRVIEYVAQRYGRDNVSQIITFGTMTAKAVVRDVGRVLGHPYGFVDKLSKLIPFELGITLEKALAEVEELNHRYQTEEEVTSLFDLALKLEGVTRNAGKHAGGVVIAPSALTDFTAIYCEEGSLQRVSQFDKDDVEAVGLVKFDFLGLRTLTIIDWTLKSINALRPIDDPILIDMIAMDDVKTFELLKQCETTAVFQVESRGMKELIHRLKPDCFEDIIALVALYRPGPLQSGMVDDFIDRKHGRAAVVYDHPDLETILKPTYGVILYQEQVMQIAQVLANYTLGAADLLRRAMGKKKPEEMARQREIFIEGALARGISAEISAGIFDLMEKFAGYGFNKSHSAAYALLSYQTAWLKAHYPAAFMAAVLSSDMDNTDKVVSLLQECKRMKLSIESPSIFTSGYYFSVKNERTITYGLGAIKGLGQAAIQGLMDTRTIPFKDLFDLCARVDLRRINRRVLETLIKSGCLDDWGYDRALLMNSLDKAMQEGSVAKRSDVAYQQLSLFDDIELSQSQDILNGPYLPWTDAQRLMFEKETLGFYLRGHPVDAWLHEFSGLFIDPAVCTHQSVRKSVLYAALLVGIRRVSTRQGRIMLIFSLEHQQFQFEAVCFEEKMTSASVELKTGQVFIFESELSLDSFSGGMKHRVVRIFSLDSARAHFAKRLKLIYDADSGCCLEKLVRLIEDNPGPCPVEIHYFNHQQNVKVCLAVSSGKNVLMSEHFLSGLIGLIGAQSVQIDYAF